MLQIEKDKLIFSEIIKILSNIKCYNNFNDIIDSIFINNLINNLKPIDEEILLLFEMNEEFQNNELYQGIHGVYQIYYELNENIINENILLIDQNIENQYCNFMKPIQFGIQEVTSNHRFISEINKNPEPLALRRIISEISSFKSDLPLNYDSSIWIRIPKKNMNLFTFIISGPKDTPYENGLFEFHAFFPINYPLTEPKVLINTTGNNKVRFNPNLYHCGKVCLSLLGTWSGHESEKWNPKTSTFLQVLVSIQSLILVENPYFNEPGYEKSMGTTKGNLLNFEYNEVIRYHTIELAIINQILNPPLEYKEIIHNHFKIKKDDILQKCELWATEAKSYKSQMENIYIKLKEALNSIS
jgi:baculoviral IAP repeat-containing protein 6